MSRPRIRVKTSVGAAVLVGVLSAGAGFLATAPEAAAYGPAQGTGQATTTTSTTIKAASGTGLAFTGTDAIATTAAGAVAIGAGGLFVLVTRRRRASR